MLNATRKTTLALLLGCAVQVINAQPVQKTPSAGELREWAAGPCIDAGKKYAGIDYARSLDRAIANDSAGLAALFRFTDSGGFDGAAAEGYCAILFGLLQRWGDRKFSRVLRAQKNSVRKAVFDVVTTFPYFKRAEFPLTYASGAH